MARIGLMGGTFDPPHFGHLFIAEAARHACELDEVIWIPTGQPAHAEGKTARADAPARFEMTRRAIASHSHFSLSRLEIDRPGPSYAFDTVRELQKSLGAETELWFIVGGDSIAEILTWYRGEELLEMCHFVAASRPGASLDDARERLSPSQRARVVWLEIPGLHIASRELRARVARDEPIRYLVPDEVQEFIVAHGLYRSN